MISALFQRVRSHVRDRPDAPALIPDSSSAAPPASYVRLWRTVEYVRRDLQARGIRPGGRLMVVAPSRPVTIPVLLGAMAAGTCAPVHPDVPQPFARRTVERLKPDLLLAPAGEETYTGAASAAGVPVVFYEEQERAPAGTVTLYSRPGMAPPAETEVKGERRVRNRFDQDVPAIILFTSGSTGPPRMVPLTFRNLSAGVRNFSQALDLSPADCVALTTPLYHVPGIVTIVLTALATGGAVVVPGGGDPENLLDCMERHPVTWFSSVCTTFFGLLRVLRERGCTRFPSRLRFIRTGGMYIAPEVMRDMRNAFGVPVINSYGLTEATSTVATSLPGDDASCFEAGCVGRSIGPDVAIIDEDGEFLPRGETGQVVIRGDTVTPGYLDDPEANTASFFDGWFKTGDLGRLTEDGRLFVLGRIKDIINCGGEKLSPAEIETILLHSPLVEEAAVFPLPHPTLGEVPAACVVPVPGKAFAEDAILRFARNRLPRFAVPVRIFSADSLPRTVTAKVDRAQLVRHFAAQWTPADGDAPARVRAESDGSSQSVFEAPLEVRVARIWQSVLGTAGFGPDDHLFELGGDSFAAGRIAARVSEEFGVDVPIETIFSAPTVRLLAREIAKNSGRDVDVGA